MSTQKSIEQTLLDHLVANGMSEAQATAAFGRFKASPLSVGRISWSEPPSIYPADFMATLTLSLRAVALEYIDETCPQAWFRPMFERQA